jgi:hypothetical protein
VEEERRRRRRERVSGGKKVVVTKHRKKREKKKKLCRIGDVSGGTLTRKEKRGVQRCAFFRNKTSWPGGVRSRQQ